MLYNYLAYILLLNQIKFAQIHSKNNNNGEDQKFVFNFLPGSTMGIFLAVAFPFGIPESRVYLGYSFEAAYSLPSNGSNFEFPPILPKYFTRKWLYHVIEDYLQSKGYNGRACLLRAICETALHSLNEVNGILGDILHVVLTPSTSTNTNLHAQYNEAELNGKNSFNCKKFIGNCSISIFEEFSVIRNDEEVLARLQ